MNTDPTRYTGPCLGCGADFVPDLDEGICNACVEGAYAAETVSVTNGANLDGVAPLVTMQRTGDWKHYQPPASDRPSGAARKRLRWSEQAARSKDWRRRRLLGADPTPPKAGIARGRQGVKRG